MTTTHSAIDDNGGLCEGCNTEAPQHTYPLLLAGFGPDGRGPGWGTIWLCDACADRRSHKFTLSDVPTARRPGSTIVDLLALEAAMHKLATLVAPAVDPFGATVSRAMAAYRQGAAAATDAPDTKLRVDPHAPATCVDTTITCMYGPCRTTAPMAQHTHHELGAAAVMVPPGWLVRAEESGDDYTITEFGAWCSLTCLNLWIERGEIRRAWARVKPHPVDHTFPGVVPLPADVRAAVEAAHVAHHAEQRGLALAAMADAFGDHWQTMAELTDAEIA